MLHIMHSRCRSFLEAMKRIFWPDLMVPSTTRNMATTFFSPARTCTFGRAISFTALVRPRGSLGLTHEWTRSRPQEHGHDLKGQ